MTEINYSLLLRKVVADYLEERISRVEYLAQRHSVLDRIDHEFNGEEDPSGSPELDATEPTDTEPYHRYTSDSFDDDDPGKH